MPGKKGGKKWRQGKDRTNPLGDRKETEMKDKKDQQYADILKKIDIIGDPYDMMNMKDKKSHALASFYDYMKVMKCKWLLVSAWYYEYTFIIKPRSSNKENSNSCNKITALNVTSLIVFFVFI